VADRRTGQSTGGQLVGFLQQLARRPILALRVGVLLLGPLLHLLVFAPRLFTGPDPSGDVMAYVLAADRVRAGEPLYEAVPPGPHEPGTGALYLYPPFLAAVAALVPLSGARLARFAMLAGLLCFWIYAATLTRVASGRITPYGTLVWGAALTLGIAPTAALFVGQIDSLIWALFGIALAWPAARGFSFAAAALIKPFSVWPLGLALWREGRPVALGAAFAVAIAVVLSAAAMGPVRFVHASVDWISRVYPAVAQGQFTYIVSGLTDVNAVNHLLGYFGTGNLSLGFLPLQLARAAGWSFTGEVLPVGARIYLTAIGIIAPVITLWLTRHRGPELRYAAVMAAAVVFGPIFRLTYSPILFALAAAWIGERRRGVWGQDRPPRRRQ
jgi:hypothetical protein